MYVGPQTSPPLFRLFLLLVGPKLERPTRCRGSRFQELAYNHSVYSVSPVPYQTVPSMQRARQGYCATNHELFYRCLANPEVSEKYSWNRCPHNSPHTYLTEIAVLYNGEGVLIVRTIVVSADPIIDSRASLKVATFHWSQLYRWQKYLV
jgi:hypothetical protein